MNKIGFGCAVALSVIQAIGAVLVVMDAESKQHVVYGVLGFSMSLMSLMYLSGAFA